METIKKLDDRQVLNFDTDYIQDNDWDRLCEYLLILFPEGDFSFLDIGGGNGVFCDKVLNAFPQSTAVLLDNSEYLISLNKQSERKRIICDSVENIDILFPEEKFDVVFLNLVLHHFVSNSYKATYKNVTNTFFQLKSLLSPRGYVYVFEDFYNGAIFNGLPGYLIYTLTLSKIFARLTRKLGANTAGTGVCFRSRKQWGKIINKCGYKIIHEGESHLFTFPLWKKILLHMGKVNMGYLWLKKIEG
ncbi:MAG: class I SAM-dependent methyltransferase [Dysgonamonadaceae bacterium]|jgi:SAM-dependent methyltransferase|nr:class I SAM-dependent methyltransferase [Dysgonamonadaceae bacterium]